MGSGTGLTGAKGLEAQGDMGGGAGRFGDPKEIWKYGDH